MSSFCSLAWSSVGKKLITGLTGLMLIGFITVHLIGNLTLLMGPGPFNHYAHFLESLGHGLIVILFEAGLILIVLFHGWTAFTVSVMDKFRARPTSYEKSVNAGGASRKTLSSVTMIYSGAIILLFMIMHVKSFKYGGALMISDGHGGQIKDLYTVVAATFSQLWAVITYCVVMICVGFHLRHGIWSAFQSLGLANKTAISTLDRAALILSILFALVFMSFPLIMFFQGDATAVHAALTGGR
jgi:succinate dehydrogenase / fumarate reductase, cytochrome b subunit